MRNAISTSALVCAAVLGCCLASVQADEGMWLVNKPPVPTLKQRYNFEPTPQWLEHAQKSAVRIGASGSLVSPRGLLMTNHHVASDAIDKLSTPEHNYMETGFYAATPEQELKCSDMEISILWSIEDVTDKVKGAAKDDMSMADANTARRKMMATIEKEEQDKTGLECSIVTLYQGGKYNLYRYKRFTDVRLVFCPEFQAAFFGGDADNFEYPRYDLDVTFFRVYENDKPYQPEHYFKWAANGSKEGDLAIVYGHPGRTQRLLTADHLRFIRDVEQPLSLQGLWRGEVKMQTFAGRSVENERIAQEDIFGIANSRKALTGQLSGLQDPALFNGKVSAEDALRAAVSKSPEWTTKTDNAWAKLSAALEARRAWNLRYSVLSRGLGSDLYGYARTILRLSDELPKPSPDRLREFRDSNLPSVYLNLYSTAPYYESLDTYKLTQSIAGMAERLGAEDPTVVKILGGKSPRARAEELIAGCKLRDPETRKKLVEGGTAALASINDPMIELAKALDAEARALRKQYEDSYEAVERDAYAKIAAARFAIEGDSNYPDATGTLRMSFGPVKGYVEEGKNIPAYTNMGGMFEKAAQRDGDKAFKVAKRWAEHKNAIDPKTPFNFVCTADIIGGNSGSPVINTKGEIIGLIFDGNIQSLPGAFAYSDKEARAVAVDGRAIIEALRKVYDAGTLADEILGNTDMNK